MTTEPTDLDEDPEVKALNEKADAVLEQYRTTPPLPEVLYHYTSLDAALLIIPERTMWCSNVVYANDPAEATYSHGVLDEVADTDRQLRLQGLRAVLTELDCYAISFSAAGDLLPQWRAYCRNGRGVAIGVDTDVLRRRSKLILMRVVYDRSEQRQFVKDMMDVFRAAILSARTNTARLSRLMDALAMYLVIVRSALKSSTYDSEREYRLFDVLPADRAHHGTQLDFRVSGAVVVPYFKVLLTKSNAANAAQPFHDVRTGPCLDYRIIARALETLGVQEGLTFSTTASTVQMRCD